jgi:hypothetical protein
MSTVKESYSTGQHHSAGTINKPLQSRVDVQNLLTNQFQTNFSFVPTGDMSTGIPPSSVYYQTSIQQPAQQMVTAIMNAVESRPQDLDDGSKGELFQFEMFDGSKKENGKRVNTQCF